MNAANRAALQKRKHAMMLQRQAPASLDIEEIRNTTRLRLADVLKVDVEVRPQNFNEHVDRIARDIENSLNAKYAAPSASYRMGFRRLYLNFKNKANRSKLDLLNGTLNASEFAKLSPEELKSQKQKARDDALKEENMRQSVGVQLLPENVNFIKDGRDREKWGVSKSSAAVDD